MFKRIKTSLYRFYYKHLSQTRHKIVDVHGAEFCLRPDNYIDRKIWVESGYEKQQISTFLTYIENKKIDAFIDIGANFGLYTCILARCDHVKSVYSIECDPRNLYQLYGHLYMNDIHNKVNVYPIAASDSSGKAHLQLASKNNSGRSHIVKASDDKSVISIEQKKLDDVFDFQNKMLMFKIDVEGHEDNVLEGLAQTLKNNQCFIQIEILEETNSKADEIICGLGFKRLKAIGSDVYYSNMNEARL